MSPVIVVVTDVFTHQSVQMAFVEYDEHNSVFGDGPSRPDTGRWMFGSAERRTDGERHTVAHRTSLKLLICTLSRARPGHPCLHLTNDYIEVGNLEHLPVIRPLAVNTD